MKKIITVAAALLAVVSLQAQPQVIAHRGYHAKEGAARNTLAALENAQQLGVYGSECDVNLTSDGELVVIHGPWLGEKNEPDRLNVQKSDLATLRSKKLENGEVVPTLDEYLDQTAKDSNCKLIIEIKDHGTPQIETKLAKMVLDAVKRHKLQDRVEYIAFREHVCNELIRLAPAGTKVAYLNGTLKPKYLHAAGYTGLDYKLDVLKKNPKWIDEAHKLGLTVNVWTVNKTEDLKWVIDHNVDYITTDNPVEALSLIGR